MINKIFNNIKTNAMALKGRVNKSEESKQPATQETEKLSPYNNAYATVAIKTSEPVYTQNEKNFMEYRDKFCEVLGEVTKEYNKANWEFYINSTPENANAVNIVAGMYGQVFNDEEAYKQFKEFEEKGIKDEHLNNHLNKLMANFKPIFEPSEKTNTSEQTDNPTVSENSISQVFNGFKPQIDGKEVSNQEIQEIIRNSEDVELRKKAYIAKNSKGDAIAEDMIQLVKQRNEEAKAEGFNTYYEMMLKKYGTSEEKLFKLLDDLDKQSSAVYTKLKEQSEENICKNFGITKEEIRPWHKGFLQAGSITKEANKFFTKENLVPVANDMYSKMGWNLQEMSITMDLFPRDNKNGHGFCFCIEPGKDARILANLDGDLRSIETLLHESGHAVYDIGLPTELPLFDREYASNVTTEAVAMLMENLPQREGFYAKSIGMPKELNDKLETQRLENLTGFIKSYIFYSNFEKQLYENPDQDVKKLWFDLKQQYTGDNPPDELNNEWATVPHFLTHPGYLQNYLRAEVMAAQIYDAAHEQLGNLTETKETADFFRENIFKYGASKSEDEIIKIATGKELSAEAFCKQLEKINQQQEEKVS